MADIDLRLNHIEGKVDDIKSSLDEVLDRMDTHSESIRSLDQWRKGNGALGAEARLQSTELAALNYQRTNVPERLNCIEAEVLILQKVADGKIQDAVSLSVKTTMDARDKTAISYIKAIGSAVGGLGGAAALVAVLLKAFT